MVEWPHAASTALCTASRALSCQVRSALTAHRQPRALRQVNGYRWKDDVAIDDRISHSHLVGEYGSHQGRPSCFKQQDLTPQACLHRQQRFEWPGRPKAREPLPEGVREVRFPWQGAGGRCLVHAVGFTGGTASKIAALEKVGLWKLS